MDRMTLPGGRVTCPGIAVTVAIEQDGSVHAVCGHLRAGEIVYVDVPADGERHFCCGRVTKEILAEVLQRGVKQLAEAHPTASDVLTILPQHGSGGPSVRTWRHGSDPARCAVHLWDQRWEATPPGTPWDAHGRRLATLRGRLFEARRRILQNQLTGELRRRGEPFKPLDVVRSHGGECFARLPLTGYLLADALGGGPGDVPALLRDAAAHSGLGLAYGSTADAAALLLGPVEAAIELPGGALRIVSRDGELTVTGDVVAFKTTTHSMEGDKQ